jgi:hypothetical protein
VNEWFRGEGREVLNEDRQAWRAVSPHGIPRQEQPVSNDVNKIRTWLALAVAITALAIAGATTMGAMTHGRDVCITRPGDRGTTVTSCEPVADYNARLRAEWEALPK